MYKTQKVLKTYEYETETISEVTCDCCGKNVDINNKDVNGKEKYINVKFYLKNSYEPDIPLSLQLCNDCVRTLYLSMKYKSENDENYESDAHYYFDKDEDFETES